MSLVQVEKPIAFESYLKNLRCLNLRYFLPRQSPVWGISKIL